MVVILKKPVSLGKSSPKHAKGKTKCPVSISANKRRIV
jgi:hypothetical protein